MALKINNREKINQLELSKAKEIELICDKYDIQLEKLYYKFSLEEVIDLGWSQHSYYAPGSSEWTGDEYLYKKNGKFIRVNHKTLKVSTYGVENSYICDLEELENYSQS